MSERDGHELEPPGHFVDLDAPTHRSSPTILADHVPALTRAGTVEFGDYELLEEIARGGMGVVYRARQKSLSRVVALKMILAGQLASAEDVMRFHAEAQSAANLRHDAIVAIHEVGEHAGHHYFTMEFIEGESLASRLARGPLPALEAARLLQAIAEAIQHAHEQQIIHRDLKPANILLDQRNHPHVTDFGLAKRGAAVSETIRPGQVVGTPAFMPPEQAGGKWGAITLSVDVYSLGAVLYAAITGQAPFNAPTPLDTLMLVLEQEPAWPRTLNRTIPRDLEAIVMKCLKKSPSARYATAQQVADDLQRFRAGEPVYARRGDAVYLTLRWLRNNVIVAGVSGAAALLLLMLALTTSLAYLTEIQRRVRLEDRIGELESKLAALSNQLHKRDRLEKQD
jgi:serine/threonine-protein kinase